MIIRKLRLQHGWSQEHLAQISGLSIRTIQRIEKGHTAGLESLKSLAAVFNVQIDELQREAAIESDSYQQEEKLKAIREARKIKGFYAHLICYVLVTIALFIINFINVISCIG